MYIFCKGNSYNPRSKQTCTDQSKDPPQGKTGDMYIKTLGGMVAQWLACLSQD